MYTTSMAFLEALQEAGVSYIFSNFGSDHAGLIEAIAEAKSKNIDMPKVITCPNEMVALSCAQGYAQVTGRAQAVVVHVECGTQALAGAVHNALRGRAPVLIFAGLSPCTQEGELVGSRNEHIHWLQDIRNQQGIVSDYMKYSTEIRSGKNIKKLVHRAMQIAHSEPKGPVYLMAAREVMEGEGNEASTDMSRWAPVSDIALTAQSVEVVATALKSARRPLVVTSYLGRKKAAVAALLQLCERLGVGVLESVPGAMNFPHDHDLYLGNQWNEQKQNAALAEADVVLVIDSDVPWMPNVSKPSDDAVIYHIDTDPIKPSIPLWYAGSHQAFQADALTALEQLNAYLDGQGAGSEADISARKSHYAQLSAARRTALAAAEQMPTDGVITASYLTGCLRRELGGDSTILFEGVTNYGAMCDHVAPTQAGSLHNSGGGSLGWCGGAAIGAKMADPSKTVVTLSGDGTYMFTVPSTVHWMARRYEVPILQIVYNNRGWNGPKKSTLSVHPDGYASKAETLDNKFDPSPDYAGIATASGDAYGRKVERPEEVEDAIREALRVVREEKRSAVLDVWLESI